MSGTYIQFGPFENGGPPGISDSFLNGVENFLLSLNSAAYDSHISSNGSGVATFVGLLTGSLGASGRINLGAVPPAQVLSNNATITLPTGSIKNVSTTANVTGIIMSATGAVAGDMFVLINTGSAGTSLTFASSGSNVRLGSVQLAGGQWTLCIYDGTVWYVQV